MGSFFQSPTPAPSITTTTSKSQTATENQQTPRTKTRKALGKHLIQDTKGTMQYITEYIQRTLPSKRASEKGAADRMEILQQEVESESIVEVVVVEVRGKISMIKYLTFLHA